MPDVDDLLLFLDFGDVLAVIHTQEKRIDTLLLPYIKRFYGALNTIIAIRNRVMHSRPLEFDDLLQVTSLSAELERSNRSLWPNVRTMLKDLERNPELVTKITIPEALDETTKVLHNLPQVDFDDTGFVGRDRELNDLRKALVGSYPVVSVVGEGGLGKTAIALKVCYEMLDKEGLNLDAIIWATAKTISLIKTLFISNISEPTFA